MNEKVNSIYWAAATLAGLLMDNDYEGEINRVILIGAHGTGKSTLANALSKVCGMPVVESVAREFFKDWKYMEDNDIIDPRMPQSNIVNTKQNILCSMSRWDFMRWVNAKVPCIMTRCPLDTIAYAMADSKVNGKMIENNLEILQKYEDFNNAIKRSLFVYLPIEFALEDDGMRPTDKDFQKNVDGAMRSLMYDFKITPLVVTGSVEERVESVMIKMFGEEIAKTLIEVAKE